MQCIFQTGVFPDKMKLANVVPLFKSGEKKCYRPISFLPQFLKFVEKLHNEKMDTFINKYGFISNTSTSHALLVLELVEELIQVHWIIRNILLEHDILANKLYCYGVRGIAHKWLLSYLKDKKQFVHFNNYNSETLNVSCFGCSTSINFSKKIVYYIH